ncbi:hypothetical protein SNE40_015155 [Patella caerulea]|uniref:Profilin n=1 Tax=Patella caerulea TaxID=87958 RepID=A0AAN8PIM2_PATCE
MGGPSWKDYIDALLEKGYVSKVAIHGLKDGKRWAGCFAFDVSQTEVAELIKGFTDSSYLRQEGISLNGVKYTLTRVSEGKIMVGRDGSTGAGCVVYKCNTCLLVCVHDEGISPGGCYTVVERIGDFLRNQSL